MTHEAIDYGWYSSSSEDMSLSDGDLEDLSSDLEESGLDEKFQDCTLCDSAIDTDVDILHRCKTCDMIYCNPCVKKFDYVLRQESRQLITKSFIDHRCLHCYFDYTADMVGRGVYKLEIN